MSFPFPFGQPQEAGQLGVDFEGHLEMGLGGGLAIGLEDGGLEFNGIDID
ncbi:hypothetical protein ACWGJ9_11425 [Curtobacterium citreum]